MITAAGVEGEEDLAAMFGVEIEFVSDILPPALEFFAAFCEICEQNPARVLWLLEGEETGRTRDRECYFAAAPDRIGVAAGLVEIPNDIDKDNAVVEDIFKGIMTTNAGKLKFEGVDDEYSADPMENKKLFEKINAAHSEGPDPTEQALLKNIHRQRSKSPCS